MSMSFLRTFSIFNYNKVKVAHCLRRQNEGGATIAHYKQTKIKMNIWFGIMRKLLLVEPFYDYFRIRGTLDTISCLEIKG